MQPAMQIAFKKRHAIQTPSPLRGGLGWGSAHISDWNKIWLKRDPQPNT